MKQYFRNRATSLKRRINLRFINRRFILRLRYLSDEVAFREREKINSFKIVYGQYKTLLPANARFVGYNDL